MEEKYWELRERTERAWDKYVGSKDEMDYWSYVAANNEYKDYCAELLAKLMDNNPNALMPIV